MATVIGAKYFIDDDDYFLLPDEAYYSSSSRSHHHGHYDDEDGNSSYRFSPPLYRQRYSAVIEEIRKHVDDIVDKIVDFGCAEGSFLSRARLSMWRKVHVFMGVDMDEGVLETAKLTLQSETHYNDQPNNGYYETYLKDGDDDRVPSCLTWLYKGNIAEYDQRLENVDVVTAIELIEHLEEDVLEKGVQTIFSELRPYMVIFTTPNSEFNVLFNMGDRKYRHDDHKFEWTRREFQDWCQGIVSSYPKYEVQFTGIGPGPEGTEEKIGCGSQMAVFRWIDLNAYRKFKERRLKATNKQVKNNNSLAEQPYQLVARLVFPPDYCNQIYRRRAVFACTEYCRKIYSEWDAAKDDVVNGDSVITSSSNSPAREIVKDPETEIRGMWFDLEELLVLPACAKICKTKQDLANILITEECFQLDVYGFNTECKMVQYRDEDDLLKLRRTSDYGDDESGSSDQDA